MNLTLSWDLFIIVFFGIIVAYSLIIGRDNTLKVILATYASALSADAFGNLLSTFVLTSPNVMKMLKIFAITSAEEAMILSKIFIFVAVIVFFAVKGAFEVTTEYNGSMLVKLMVNLIFGFFSAALIMSVGLVFITGSSMILGGPGVAETAVNIYKNAQLAQILITYYSIWFFMPALCVVGASFMWGSKE